MILISALMVSTLLITEQSAIFLGLMRWTTSSLRNFKIPVWVVDPKVEQVNDVKPMRDTDLARIKSVEGVAWAVPLYQSIQQARLSNGGFKQILLLGIDSSSLIGAPLKILKGQIEDIRQANAVAIDMQAVDKLSVDKEHPLTIGSTFEINDHEARIVAIVKAERSFFGYPYVYTTYDRAIEFVPKQRKNLGFILVNPVEGLSPIVLSRRIEKVTGLKAFTEDEFFWSTTYWFIKNTGIPISIGTTIFLGLVIGLVVCGQTFYMFVLENIHNLAALKAMGASPALLSRMLLLQALAVGFIGFGLGVGICSIIGVFAIHSEAFPYFLPYHILVLTGIGIALICILAAFIAIRRVSKLEVAEVFRA